MLNFFILVQIAIKLSQQSTMDLDSEQQLYVENIDNILAQFTGRHGQNLEYGFWSRFNPLSYISQVGPIGIFDSDCYNLHNVVEQKTGKTNFLYYDCLDYQKKSIKKIIQFVDENEKQFNFVLDLDIYKYENTWFVFYVSIRPILKNFQFIVKLYDEILLYETVDVLFPFYDQKLVFTFGGGLSLSSKQRIDTWNANLIFSYFPGPITISLLLFQRYYIELDTYDYFQYIQQDQDQSQCLQSMKEYFKDENIKFIDLKSRTIQSSDFDAFTFSGWIKAFKIIQEDQNFLYKFIKISANSEDERLTHDNLSPFQLLYKFEDGKQYIQVLTYSYTFPSVNIDFKTTPFLIQKEFELIKTITFWHFVSVMQYENQFQLEIQIFDGADIKKLKFNSIVNHFQKLNFKIQIGNLFQNPKNYINMQIASVSLIPCKMISSTLPCDQTCESCDGPTKNDCLSCNSNSKRIYFSKQKSCDCPNDSLDQNGFCLNLVDLQFSIIQYEKPKSCQFGYFRYDDQTCIKCYICKIVRDDGYEQNLDVRDSLFVFDDEDAKFCVNCDKTNLLDLDQQYSDYQLNQNRGTQLCLLSQESDDGSCNYCSIYNCEKCQISIDGYKCLECKEPRIFINGICDIPSYNFDTDFCNTPYYLNSYNQCQLCKIENCIYCFEFLENDIVQNTLSQDFDYFSKDDYHSVGCALCKDGYKFNFIEQKCLFEVPQIQNCLRSYINLEGQEVCTLSNLQNFDLSPEIINCQQRIQNCEQCVKTNQQIIKCVLCEDGYINIVKSGKCSIYGKENIKKCIERYQFINDVWLLIVQSFTIQFLQNSDLKPKFPISSQYTSIQIISCQEGYEISKENNCVPYCQSDCLECIETNLGFQCIRCSLNNSNKPQRSRDYQNCLQCPQLCSICEIRTEKEIKILNPYFILTNENKLFTYKCIQKISSEKVYIDSEFQIARLIFDDKNNILNFDYDFSNIFQDEEHFQDFKNYQDYINTEYCNSIGADIIQVTFSFSFPQVSIQDLQDQTQYQFKTTLKQLIFALKQTIFYLISREEKHNILSGDLETFDFDQIKISGITFFLSYYSLFQFQNDSPIKMILKDIVFYTHQLMNIFKIQNTAYKEIILSNVTFINLTITDSSIFNIFGEYLEHSIQIQNIKIIGCQFTNSKFITIFNNSYPLFIQNLTIISSTFINSIILDITSQNITAKEGQIHNLQILNSQFYNTNYIQISNIEKFEINDLFIGNSHFTTSTVFTINSNFKLNNLTVEESFFSVSYFLNSQKQLFGNLITYKFQNCNFKNNRFQDSQIFLITPTYDQDQQQFTIIFEIFDISNNYAQQSISENFFLFSIHCNAFFINEIKITKQNYISIIYIHNTRVIFINQLFYQNKIKKPKIPFGNGCQNDFHSVQILKIFGFESINFENFQISQLYTQDTAIIELISDTLSNKDQIEQIKIKNMVFQENIIQKNYLGNRLSILLVYSENKQSFILEDIRFLSNLFHQTVDDPSGLISGLIYFDSRQYDINITNIEVKYNGITNSSSSFLFFTAKTLSISNYQLEGLNIFDNNLLQNYISVDYLNQEEISLIIEKILSIQTKGSACFATVSQLQIVNGVFSKVLSQTSSLFEIITQGEGIIILKDLIIKNIDIIYDSNIELQGCIKIQSQNSYLNLNLIGIQLIEVYNKLSPALLSITPSQRFNKIVLENIYILNCLSLKNQIMYVKFSQDKRSQNIVFIKNIQINQTEQAWKLQFQKIGQLSYSIIENVINDNALINLESCTLVIQSLFVQGIIISPILKIQNAIKLQIIGCKFISIETFYSFNLIEISQNNQNSMKVQINDNEFRNIKLYKSQVGENLEKIIVNDINFESNCQSEKQNFSFEKIKFSFSEIIQQISDSETSFGSIFYIQSQSNQTQVNYNKLKIFQTFCDFCKKGLVFVEVVQIARLFFQEFYCVQNSILQNGCLNIQSKKIYKNKFTIRDSIIALHLGESGIGITFSEIMGIIHNTVIFNNQAMINAGGLNIQNDDFQIKNTQILQNNADQCGGILLNQNTNINSKNFIKSILLFNKANELSNNLVEAPTQLELQINNKKMKSIQEKFENITINILTIQRYRVQQQDLIINTGILMLPSNQIISEFKIFDQKTLKFRPYITEFSLIFLNSQQEQLGNFEDYNCSVFQNILIQNNRVVNKTQVFIVTFNNTQNKIDLGNLYFSFNPYDSSNYIQQIEIQCKINQFKTLIYILNTKSFLCQLGEFQTKNGCQICEPNSGFYSVTYNATKCSIFDKNKFQNITSNTISLLPGFWRPNYLSDQTEQCIKQQNNCLGGWMVGDQSCLDGYLGGLCEECDVYNQRGSGFYFKNLQNGQCLLCNDNNSYIIIFVFVSFLAILSIMITIISIRKTNKLFVILKLRERFEKILFKLNQDHESFLIKMFLNYIWIFSLVFTYNISLSLNLNLIDQVSNTSQFMANNLDCYLSTISEINLIYIRIMATIFFIVVQFLIVCLIALLFSYIQSQKFDFSNITNTTLYLYLSNHAGLTKQFCALLTERMISNISYVQGNVSLQFQSSSHQNWIYLFILPFLFLNACFIPFLLSSILYYRRNQLNQIKIRKYICYLFNEYNDNSYYWELIKIWQKTLLIFIMTYFEAEVFLKTTLLGLTLILYQFMASARKPYIILNLNKLDFETGQICCIALFLAAARSESVQQNRYQVSNILEVIIAFLCLLLIYFYIQNILVVYVKKYKFIIFSYLRTFLNKISSKSRVTLYLEQKLLQQLMKRDKLNNNYEKLRAYFKLLSTKHRFSQNNNSRHGTKFLIGDQRIKNPTLISESSKLIDYSQKLV